MRVIKSEAYQWALIGLGAIATVMLGVFLYRELFPEYRIYQNDYIALEKFRSSYTHESPPAFQPGVKQIVIEREDHGPPTIDRCISCHVALQFGHFSATKIAHDNNGNILYNTQGIPEQVPNEEYIWGKLDQKIKELRDSKVLEQLRNQGESSLADSRLKEATQLEALKTAQVGEHRYDVTKVLAMHPLIGKETRPFEFHPLEEYGCVSCHNGNGRGLTTERAHGPIFDGQYAIEFRGPKPHFLEADPHNDPSFASAFNDKPGPELLFQTTPLFVGELIEAKCVQCHQAGQDASAGIPTKNHNKPQNGAKEGSLGEGSPDRDDAPLGKRDVGGIAASVDPLIQNYTQGQELYISQACYACHRIAGLARGGVGPELTKIGNSYPWYIKESIVWPQADLPTSTMPNMRLDHEELENLMTFLLGQTGSSKVISPQNYKIAVQAWEAGNKQPWEKSITPTQMQELRYSMSVFATEGCAACHRLKGFVSDVGYAIEAKDSTNNYEALSKEKQWFSQLFPENIPGSLLAKTLEENKAAVDQHIDPHTRTGSILEEIEATSPGQIEALYSNFKFASRAKDHFYKTQIATEKDPAKKAALEAAWKEWKSDLHNILMIYIQEYGLGRLICPRPNWSGVYRSDEWLMEHFHNPSAHVARSIMPVMPFDDTKFYALTHMLDVLGVRNRDAVHEIWSHEGFDPERAFEIHCAQCHGQFLAGNGPVSEWIYPIPKNLRNPDFLRNLTRDRIIQSITHGVKGTPMPPWGEAPKDKPTGDGVPVLSTEEIAQLTDWLLSGLPGGRVDRSSIDVPKWKYGPKDVLKELQEEGGQLPSNKTPPVDHPLSFLPRGEHYYAALQPQVNVVQPPSIEEIFDVRPNTIGGPDKELYYIKKRYYTEENIRRGRQFFELNCAACHGKEADGTGARAPLMLDAKPRMLTNLDWINTRDDLRLLRSIKYGVPGTAMTPWGDLTSSLQRLQLVIFIRSLTADRQRRDALSTALYDVFESAQLKVEQARAIQYQKLDQLQKEYDNLQKQAKESYEKAETAQASPQDAAQLYQKKLELAIQLKKQQEVDQLFLTLRSLIKQEMDLYQGIGLDLILKQVDDQVMNIFFDLLFLQKGRYSIQEGRLHLEVDPSITDKMTELSTRLTSNLQNHIDLFQKEQQHLEGRISSPQRFQELAKIGAERSGLIKLRNKLIASLEESRHITQKQQEIYNKLKTNE